MNQQTTSLDNCISLCDAYNTLNQAKIKAGTVDICNAVCFRVTITGDDFPGQCFGFETTNSSAAFVYTGDTRCDSAALINQSF